MNIYLYICEAIDIYNSYIWYIHTLVRVYVDRCTHVIAVQCWCNYDSFIYVCVCIHVRTYVIFVVQKTFSQLLSYFFFVFSVFLINFNEHGCILLVETKRTHAFVLEHIMPYESGFSRIYVSRCVRTVVCPSCVRCIRFLC